jgi:hypothetical protein
MLLKRIINFLLSATLIAFLTGCASTTIRQHEEFASGKTKVSSIVVMSPDVSYQRITFTGEDERDANKELEIANSLKSYARALLSKAGYIVKEDPLDKPDADKQLGFDFEQLKVAYGNASRDLYNDRNVSKEDSIKYISTVDAAAAPICSAAEAESVLLITFSGFDKSGGKMAQQIVLGALVGALTGVVQTPVKNGGSAHIALIEGASGKVLWTNRIALAGSPGTILATALRPIPNINQINNSAPLVPTNKTAETNSNTNKIN